MDEIAIMNTEDYEREIEGLHEKIAQLTNEALWLRGLVRGLSFEQMREVNARRCVAWHGPEWLSPEDSWTIADWSNAMAGEAGEAANVVKKIRRNECAFPDLAPSHPPQELLQLLADELADVVLYADLLATKVGLNLGTCVQAKFNRKSEEQGFEERL